MHFLTIAEAAELLRIAERAAYKLVRDGRLPAVKVGNQWRIEKGALEAWIAQGGDQQTDEERGDKA